MSTTTISYTRQFSHKDWIDFVDSVQAGGTNGINIRMHAIEAEFDTLSQVIALISTALQAPAPKPQTLTLPPALAATTSPPWAQQVGAVTVPTTGSPANAFATTASGFLSVNLPNGATIQALRVTGSSAGGILTVILYRQPLTGGAEQPVLQVLNSFPAVATAAAFDLPPAPQNANAVVDNTTYKYFIVATLTGGNPTLSAGGTTLNAFQITYTAT
ncbi:MAG TPA: hypothetical protein VFF52_26425 [Isosphaeraceae bacterium]|nr:hypothetical protein [Isosphaeraceae bacterium]